jgi:hypothetical protein
MIASNNKDLKWWFWGIIALGLLLPFLVSIVVKLIFFPKDFLDVFISISPSSFFAGIFNDIPFIIIAFMVRSLWYRPETESYQDFFKHKSGVIGAGLLTIGFSLIVNISIWVGIILHNRGSSTSVIAYFFLPFYCIVIILVGYGIGRFIGKIMLKNKTPEPKNKRTAKN